MVRLRKGLWFLLIVFLAYFSSPGYPDSKNKTIHNLPVNQDMGTKSWRYSEGGEKIELEAMKQGDCPDCWYTLNNAIKCRHCVELREDCKDCCFSDENPATGIIKCTKDDDEDYECKSELFDRDDCDPIVCDPDKCNTKCTDYEYEADSPCNGVKGTKGTVDGDANERRWQRKGCPEKDSEDLAPDGNCKEVDGSGLDRVWECAASIYQPKFSGCDLTAEGQEDLGLSKPTGYYLVVTAVTSCAPSCTKNECQVNCPTTGGACKYREGTCTPSCTPNCVADISYSSGSPSGAGASCTPSGCGVSQSCTASCINDEDACIAQKCSSACGASSCESYSSRWSGSGSTFYVYTLSEEFKDYIEECIDYADKYDACKDRVNCCEKGACQDVSVKNKKTKEYDCAPGFSDNCDDCDKRKCYHDKGYCDEFTAVDAKNSCPQLASDVHSCLTKKENSGCFKEVKIDDEPFYYPYVASSNDALNIIWQITSTSSDKDVKGLNFYTLVKVFKLGANGKPEGDPAHTSMANVKSQEAAFSIYGTTNVAKGVLKEGASYQVYLYYSLPPGEFCDGDCETCESETTIELTYVSLILQRVRE